MEAKAKAGSVQETANVEFWLGVLMPDKRHLLAASGVRQDRMTSSL
jgi:hypothetical protein